MGLHNTNAVNRHTGGLESIANGTLKAQKVNRHTGGLEILLLS